MSHLQISLLGPWQVRLDGQLIPRLPTAKVQALLAYLAVEAESAHTRDTLVGLLWGEYRADSARQNLRKALQYLRQSIPSLYLQTSNQTLQFNPASDYRLDVTQFAQLVDACRQHAHADLLTCAACVERLQEAVALYRGDLLAGFFVADSPAFEEWLLLKREWLRREVLQALHQVAAYHEQQRAYDRAYGYAWRQLELDPVREEAHQQLIRILALSGRRSEALVQYESCRRILADELGVEPAQETISLYEGIRTGEAGASSSTAHLVLPTAHPHNLPLQPTPFVGRDQELATLTDLLVNPACRLLTLLGPGGIGKTRLALQTALGLIHAFSHGVAFVALAPINSIELLVPAIATALNFALTGQTDPTVQLLNYLRQKKLLLVLDNFEHLLTPLSTSNQPGGGIDLLIAILQQASGITVLVTSREQLHLQDEWIFDVEGLETPPSQPIPEAGTQGRRVKDYSAVAFFLQQACKLQKSFVPTGEDELAIVRICQFVQGMPLAIELAAGWVRMLSCAEIAQELEQSLGFLTTTQRDLPARHRSLQALFHHSWQFLTPDEQRIFAGCSVFRGGFTREAATQVTGATLPTLAALVDKSLMRRNQSGHYEIHELARQYGAAKLDEAQRTGQVRNRHLTFYMVLAAPAENSFLLSGEQQAQWFAQLEAEHDNLRAALDWSVTGGEFEPGLRMVGALAEFWMSHGHLQEGRAQVERFLLRPEAATRTLERAKALHTAGLLDFNLGNYQAALTWLAESSAIARELGPAGKFVLGLARLVQGYIMLHRRDFAATQVTSQESLALGQELQNAYISGHAYHILGRNAWGQGNYPTARLCLVESIECFQAAGHRYISNNPLRSLGEMLYEQGDYLAARTYLTRSCIICREMGAKTSLASTLVSLGGVALAEGNPTEGQRCWNEALGIWRDLDDLTGLAYTLDSMGRLAQQHGHYPRACTLQQESLTIFIDIGNGCGIAHALEAFGCLAAAQEEPVRAAQLFGAADVRFTVDGTSLFFTLRPVHDHLLAAARDQLGEAAFTAAWVAGEAMTLEEAVALALAKA